MKIINNIVIKEAFTVIVEKLKDNREKLNKLDSEIGDSDHGQSVLKAFDGADKRITDNDSKDIGILLEEAAKSIISTAGGATGPLYGSAFLEASKVLKGKEKLGHSDIENMLKAMEEGICKRGQARPGDKTMLDTLHPAVEAYSDSAEIVSGIENALEAAEKGKLSTKNMVSNIGRSKRLGQRSKGHIDPGAASMKIVLEGLLKTFQNHII